MPRLIMNWKRKGKDRFLCGAYEVRTNYCVDAATGFKHVLNFELWAQDTYVRTFDVCGEAKSYAREMEMINTEPGNVATA